MIPVVSGMPLLIASSLTSVITRYESWQKRKLRRIVWSLQPRTHLKAEHFAAKMSALHTQGPYLATSKV